MESIIGFFGNKWNEVMRYLYDDFSNSEPHDKMQYADNVRQICATAGAMVAPQPIPIADIWLITPIQYLMVRAIGNIYGYRISEAAIGEIFAVIGGGVTGQQLCLTILKLGIPGLGGLVGASFVFAWTHIIGHAAEAYFKSGMTMSAEELAEIRTRYGDAISFRNAVYETTIKGTNVMRAEQGVVGWDWDGQPYTHRKFKITFAKPFKTPPIIQTSIIMMDSWSDDDMTTRIWCTASHIDNEGADIEVGTWRANKIGGLKIQWTAIGE